MPVPVRERSNWSLPWSPLPQRVPYNDLRWIWGILPDDQRYIHWNKRLECRFRVFFPFHYFCMWLQQPTLPEGRRDGPVAYRFFHPRRPPFLWFGVCRTRWFVLQSCLCLFRKWMQHEQWLPGLTDFHPPESYFTYYDSNFKKWRTLVYIFFRLTPSFRHDYTWVQWEW